MAEKEILKVTEAEYIAMFFGHKGKPVETIEVEPVGKVDEVVAEEATENVVLIDEVAFEDVVAEEVTEDTKGKKQKNKEV